MAKAEVAVYARTDRDARFGLRTPPRNVSHRSKLGRPDGHAAVRLHLGAWFGPRLTSFFLGVLSVISILLAAVGLYGAMVHAVSQRTREIGIRMAIGADREGVLRMVLRRGLLLALSGIAAGLAITLAARARTNQQTRSD